MLSHLYSSRFQVSRETQNLSDTNLGMDQESLMGTSLPYDLGLPHSPYLDIFAY